MALDLLPNKKIFIQRDVRETPSSTATATSVGLTTPQYLTLATDADLVNERVLTAGEGIDFTDAGAGSTLTINGENASDTNKGVASFDATDFTITTGNVVLSTERISDLVGAMVTGNTETGITVTYQDADNTLDFAVTTATSATLGIASFNSTDFLVTAGAVTLANKTSYRTFVGGNFTPGIPATDDVATGNGIYTVNSGFSTPCVNISIPNGAVITGVVVYGNAAANDKTWYLKSINSSLTLATLATAAVNTEDTTISTATVDNSTLGYFLYVDGMSTAEAIYFARVSFTTDYD